MRFWNFEIRWVTPEIKVELPVEEPKKKPTVKKATTRPKKSNENKKPVRTTKAKKVA